MNINPLANRPVPHRILVTLAVLAAGITIGWLGASLIKTFLPSPKAACHYEIIHIQEVAPVISSEELHLFHQSNERASCLKSKAEALRRISESQDKVEIEIVIEEKVTEDIVLESVSTESRETAPKSW